MPSLEEIAPDLSVYINEAQAEDLVTATAAGPDPQPRISNLADLGANKRQLLLLWLKWYRNRRVPLEIPALATLLESMTAKEGLAKTTRWFLRQSPKSVALKLNLEPDFLASLLGQVAAIRAEVARGDDAWMPPAVTPTITNVQIDVPSPGSTTIVGTDFDSYATKVTAVRLERPGVGSVVRTQPEIEAAGGSVSATEIIIPGSIVPAGGVQAGDLITVRADGLDSFVFTVGG